MKHLISYVSFIFILFITTANSSQASNPAEVDHKTPTLQLKIAYYDQKDVEISPGREQGFNRGSSSTALLNYFVISGSETLQEFIARTYEHDIATNPNARYEEYPFIFSLQTKQGISSHHLASLLIPRPEALEKDKTLVMTLLISSLINEEHAIPFSKKKTDSPREFEHHLFKKEYFPDFLTALIKNCQIQETQGTLERLDPYAKKLFTQAAHLINELKSLWKYKKEKQPVPAIDPTLSGYFMMYHLTLNQIVQSYGPHEKTKQLQKSISDMTGMKLPTPRKTQAISDPAKSVVKKKKIVKKKKRVNEPSIDDKGKQELNTTVSEAISPTKTPVKKKVRKKKQPTEKVTAPTVTASTDDKLELRSSKTVELIAPVTEETLLPHNNPLMKSTNLALKNTDDRLVVEKKKKKRVVKRKPVERAATVPVITVNGLGVEKDDTDPK